MKEEAKHPTAIFVIGCPRSGTSMTAAILHLCGAWGRLAVDGNVRSSGFHLQVLDNKVLEPALSLGGNAVKKGRFTLPNLPLIPSRIESLRDRIHGVLHGLSWNNQTYVIRSRLLLPFVRSLLDQMPEARIILVRRSPEAIGNASVKTGWMAAVAERKWWQDYAKLYNAELHNLELIQDPRVMTLYPSSYLRGDLEDVKAVVKLCGLTWTKEADALLNELGTEEKQQEANDE